VSITVRRSPYRSGYSQLAYDLRRLRLDGLIRRIERTHTDVLTPEGQRIAIFYTSPCNRLLRPLAAAGQRQAPPRLRRAPSVIDHRVDGYSARARLEPALKRMTLMLRVWDRMFWVGSICAVARLSAGAGPATAQLAAPIARKSPENLEAVPSL
jgi:hypothetical protein